MSVNILNPEYVVRLKDWEVMRDCAQGQRHIKSKGIKYLPKSAGQEALEKANPGCKGPYESYKEMARFPDLVDGTSQGFVGLATRKPWDIQGIPRSMEYLWEDAGHGLGLIDWQSLLISEGLEVGRYALFPDSPMEGGLPKIAWYQTESIINWKLKDGNPWLVVFREDVPAADEQLFEHRIVQQYRVIRIENGQSIVEIYDHNGDLTSEPLSLNRGKDYVPVVIGGAVNNDWEIDKPPLLGIAEAAIAYYQLSAQQRWAIRATCDPMFLALGFDVGEIQIIGGGSVLEKNVKPGDASFQPIEVSGSGIDKATEQMVYEMLQAEKQSHLLTEKAAIETSTSLRQRTNSKTASLKTVDRCAAQALEKTLNLIAEMQGINANITVISSYDYTDEEIDAVALEKISTVVERAHLPKRYIIEYVQARGGLESYAPEDIISMIEQDKEDMAGEDIGLSVSEETPFRRSVDAA